MGLPIDLYHQMLDEYHNVPDIVIIGGGPSLKNFQLNQIESNNNQLIISCNQSIFQIPHAQIAHHSDHDWWQEFSEAMKEIHEPLISGCGLGRKLKYDATRVLELKHLNATNLHQFLHDQRLVCGNNAGLQALSMAHLFLPKRIWLIGFDFQYIDQESHGYIKNKILPAHHYEKMWQFFLKDFYFFEKLKTSQWSSAFGQQAKPEIFNLNAQSKLQLYPTPNSLPDFLRKALISKS